MRFSDWSSYLCSSDLTLLKIRKRLDAYLSACQLGITFASLGLGWVGEPAFSRLVAPLLHQFGVQSPEVIHNTSVAIAFGLISFLHIVLGELAPKSIAIRRRSEEHTSELQSLMRISYAVFCLKKKNNNNHTT